MGLGCSDGIGRQWDEAEGQTGVGARLMAMVWSQTRKEHTVAFPHIENGGGKDCVVVTML